MPRQILQDKFRFGNVFLVLIKQIAIPRIITKDAHVSLLTSKCSDDVADAVDV